MIDGGGKILAITAEADVSAGVDAHAGFGNLGIRSPVSEDDTRDQNVGRGLSGLKGYGGRHGCHAGDQWDDCGGPYCEMS